MSVCFAASVCMFNANGAEMRQARVMSPHSLSASPGSGQSVPAYLDPNRMKGCLSIEWDTTRALHLFRPTVWHFPPKPSVTWVAPGVTCKAWWEWCAKSLSAHFGLRGGA